jgi:methyl-accepting chemotaxis protein
MNHLKNEEIHQMRQTLMEERKNQLRDVVSNAYSVLETANFYEPAQAAISNMQFGENDQNYFFVFDQKGMFWVNPHQPELVGKVNMNLVDAKGKPYIEEIINNSKSAQNSFIEYYAYKPDSKLPSKKLVYFKKFEKWNWIVCAGIFVDDIDEILHIKEMQIRDAMINQMKLFSIGELLALLISVTISRRFFWKKLVKPIKELTKVANEMIDGNFKEDIDIKSCSEINQLVNVMQRMQDSFTIVHDRLRIRTAQLDNILYVSKKKKRKNIPNLQSERKHVALRSTN